jgi:hypothetical protein
MVQPIIDEAKSHCAFDAAVLTMPDEEIVVCAVLRGIASARRESQYTGLPGHGNGVNRRGVIITG